MKWEKLVNLYLEVARILAAGKVNSKMRIMNPKILIDFWIISMVL